MKIKMLVELDYDAKIMHSSDDDKEEKRWFMETVLLDKRGLILHSNEIGDHIGMLTVLEVHPF